MADKYVPGMEFQSWRSLPKITDMLDHPGIKAFGIGGLINALSGGSTQLPTNQAELQNYRQGIAGAVTPPDQTMQNPANPAARTFQPPAIPLNPGIDTTIQPDGSVPPVTQNNSFALPKLPDINNEPSIFDQINGIRR
jgi:hypothetical protein